MVLYHSFRFLCFAVAPGSHVSNLFLLSVLKVIYTTYIHVSVRVAHGCCRDCTAGAGEGFQVIVGPSSPLPQSRPISSWVSLPSLSMMKEEISCPWFFVLGQSSVLRSSPYRLVYPCQLSGLQLSCSVSTFPSFRPCFRPFFVSLRFILASRCRQLSSVDRRLSLALLSSHTVENSLYI